MKDIEKTYQFSNIYYFIALFIANQLLGHYLKYKYFCGVDIDPPLLYLLNKQSGSFILSIIFFILYLFLYFKLKGKFIFSIKPILLFCGFVWVFDIIFQIIILFPFNNLFKSCSSTPKWKSSQDFLNFSWTYNIIEWIILILITIIWYKWWIPKSIKKGWDQTNNKI